MENYFEMEIKNSSEFKIVNESLNENYEETLQAIEDNNFCKIFNTAKPLLTFLSNLFLIPKKWRVIIDGLIVVSEKFCTK